MSYPKTFSNRQRLNCVPASGMSVKYVVMHIITRQHIISHHAANTLYSWKRLHWTPQYSIKCTYWAYLFLYYINRTRNTLKQKQVTNLSTRDALYKQLDSLLLSCTMHIIMFHKNNSSSNNNSAIKQQNIITIFILHIYISEAELQEMVDRRDWVSCRYILLINIDKTKVMASDGIACRILIQNENWRRWICSHTLGLWLRKMVSVRQNSVPG